MASLTLKPIQAKKLSQSLKGPAAAGPPPEKVFHTETSQIPSPNPPLLITRTQPQPGPTRVQAGVSEGAINSPGHWDFFLSHTQRDPLAG